VSFNYRGYAYSTGKPSEKSLFSDAIEQYDWLVNSEKIDPSTIILMGRSLGTGVAVYLSSVRSVGKVILVTPYDSIEAVAQDRYFFLPVAFLLKNKFDSVSYARTQTSSLLSIYA
jgi:uncharacterized protein